MNKSKKRELKINSFSQKVFENSFPARLAQNLSLLLFKKLMFCSEMLLDFENDIPVNNLQLHRTLSELSVKVVKAGNGKGFAETKIERLKLQKKEDETQRQISIARACFRPRPIANTICLSVEDLKLATKCQDCWRVYDCWFRRVLIYGKTDVLNQYSKDRSTCYKFLTDDGSERIVATMKLSKEVKTKRKIQFKS